MGAAQARLGDLSYIRVVRRDEVRQAISLVRALKTDIWVERTQDQKETHEISYKRKEIESAIFWLARQREVWDDFFAEQESRALTVAYEEFCHDPVQMTYQLLRWLDIKEPSRNIPAPNLKAQADVLTDKWVELYLSGE